MVTAPTMSQELGLATYASVKPAGRLCSGRWGRSEPVDSLSVSHSRLIGACCGMFFGSSGQVSGMPSWSRSAAGVGLGVGDGLAEGMAWSAEKLCWPQPPDRPRRRSGEASAAEG